MADMRQECLEAVGKALGREIAQAEGRNIVERIRVAGREIARRDPQRYLALPIPDRLVEAARTAAMQLVGEAQLKQKRVALSIAAKDKIETYTNQQIARGADPHSLDALERTLIPKNDGKNNIVSVDTQMKGIRAYGLSRLVDTWEAISPRFMGLFRNKEGEEALLLALHGDKRQAREFTKGAEVFHDLAEELRQRYNAAGGKIGRLDNWGMPHSWSDRLSIKEGKDAFVGDFMKWVDRSHYVWENGKRFTDDEMRTFLENAWTTIATDGANKQHEVIAGLGAVKANRHGEHRQLHFKDPESALAANRKYSEVNLFQSLDGHVRSMARDIALIETFGPNPDHLFGQLVDDYSRRLTVGAPENKGKFQDRALWLTHLYNTLAGNNPPPPRNWIGTMFQDVRNVLTGAALGSSAITSITDEGTLYMTARVNHLPALQVFMNEVRAFNPFNRTEKALARRSGLMVSAMMEEINRFGEDNAGPRTSAKISNLAIRLSGLSAMTDARRRAFSVTMLDAIGNLTRRVQSLAKLDPDDHHILLSKGITQSDWDIWRAAQLEHWEGNHTVLTADAVMRVPDAAVDASIQPQIGDIRRNTGEHVQKLVERNVEEQGWIQGREQKFRDYQDKINRSVREIVDRKEARLTTQTDALKAQQEAFEAELSLTKVYLGLARKVAGYTQGNVALSTGKALGEDVGTLTRRVAETDVKAREAVRSFGKDTDARVKAASRQIEERRAELKEFIAESSNRQNRRVAVAMRLTGDIGKQIAEARMTARQQAATKLLGAVLEEQDIAVIEAGTRERAMMSQGITRGTVKGELLRSFYLFKGFPWAMVQRHWERGLKMYESLPGKVGYLSTLIATQTLLGAVALELNDLLSGRNPRSLSFDSKYAARNWVAAFTKGGALGFYGDLLFADDRSLMAGASGPVGDLLESVDDVTRRSALRTALGEGTGNVGGQAVRLLKRVTPGANLWYAKAALDHLIFQQLQEYFSPGYLNRTKNRARRTQGTTYWWEPGQSLSQARPPEFAQ